MNSFEHITLISGNADKIKEIAALMPGIKTATIDLVEIQEIDAAKIIAEKLRVALSAVKGPIIVDDTSLYLDCFGGKLPGPLVKWFVRTIKNVGLANVALKLGNDKATAKSIIGYASNTSNMLFFEGVVEGTLIQVPEQERARYGHGWDNIFKPKGQTVTFADMDLETKNLVSPRAQAINQLVAYLKSEHAQ